MARIFIKTIMVNGTINLMRALFPACLKDIWSKDKKGCESIASKAIYIDKSGIFN